MTQNLITTLKRRIVILVMPPLFIILAYIQRRPFSTMVIPSAPSRLDKGGSSITCNSENPAATATNKTGPERLGNPIFHFCMVAPGSAGKVEHKFSTKPDLDFPRRLPHSKNSISCTDTIVLTIFQKINHVPKKEIFYVGC